MHRKQNLLDLISQFSNERLISFIATLGVMALLFLDQKVLDGRLFSSLLIIQGTAAAILLFVFSVIAGYVVLKSLFLLGAELTLLIFLAQSYCDASLRNEVGDSALRALVLFSVGYIIFLFFKSLYKSLVEYSNSIPEKEMGWKVFMVILLLIFVSIFILWIYQVVNPIILSLCVYE